MIIHRLNKTNINGVWGGNRCTSRLYDSNTTKLKTADTGVYSTVRFLPAGEGGVWWVKGACHTL